MRDLKLSEASQSANRMYCDLKPEFLPFQVKYLISIAESLLPTIFLIIFKTSHQGGNPQVAVIFVIKTNWVRFWQLKPQGVQRASFPTTSINKFLHCQAPVGQLSACSHRAWM